MPRRSLVIAGRGSPTGALAEVACLVAVGPWDGCGALQLRDDLTEVPAVVRHAVGGGGQRQRVPAAAAVLVGFVDEVAEDLSGRAVLSTTRPPRRPGQTPLRGGCAH